MKLDELDRLPQNNDARSALLRREYFDPDPPSKPGQAEMREADALVNGERQADYGTPRQNYEGIAKVWSGILTPILKRDITPEEAALMMTGLKLQREAMKHKRDNVVDAFGYLLVLEHIRAGHGQ